jgi:high-affinity iron transporter
VGALSAEEAVLTLHADWLDTYQARLTEALDDLANARANNFPARTAEHAALARGYFNLLAPAYAEQRGASALRALQTEFAQLQAAALTEVDFSATLAGIQTELQNFRAAPLSPETQSRRAGQLLRYLSLVPIEYGRGVVNGVVTQDIEIQEAVTFFGGAKAAFSDLRSLLAERDSTRTQRAADLLNTVELKLNQAATQPENAPSPDSVRTEVEALTTLLTDLMPAEWQKQSAAGDFDVIETLLDQMEIAVRKGDYALAESARLEAYAIMEVGPEAKLMAFAPQMKLTLEALFWNGQDTHKGLAYLLKTGAPLSEIKATRLELDKHLNDAQAMLSQQSAPLAVATNAGLIVFREGLEAVVILASLMSSLKGTNSRLRRPLWVGTLAALLGTVATWLLARGVLQALARYGETLEAVVSLIAIAILLLITNWFFHKVYWTDWIASFHQKKKRLISGAAGLWLGLATLGFTSVYREGFETVLFLQALVLEAGNAVVLSGVAVGFTLVVLVGFAIFKFQVNLPQKKILIVTGVLIGGVLLTMVGHTTHILQVIGWLPLHPIAELPLPYWLGIWFGLYPTWEGLLLQAASAIFVIGSYYLAENMKDTKRQTTPTKVASQV